MSTRRVLTALALVGGLAHAPAASANGRFPRAQRLVESATDPDLLALYGTYGLIVSSDAGRTWNHVCEAATGTYTGEDPLVEILPDGKIVARTEGALVRSGTTWCDWNTLLGNTANSVTDITRAESSPTTIFALLGSYAQGRGFSSQFSRSADGGVTWSANADLPVIARGLSIDVAPSSLKRLYVSGIDSNGVGQLLVSDDGGGSWQGKPIATTGAGSAPYLAVVSKTDPNRIFVRTDAYETVNGVNTASDALLVSLDGGSTWTTVIHRTAKLFGFALSPDESTLLAGYGDPVATETYVAAGDIGIYRIDVATLVSDIANAASHFEKIFSGSVTCLRWTATGLFACTSQKDVGFEVGRAPNAGFTATDAHPFESLLDLTKVRPLPCAAGTRGAECYSDPINGFRSVCGVFQTSCDAGTPPPASHVDAGSSNGGTAGSSGAGGAGVGGQAGTPAKNTSSCACRSAAHRSTDDSGVLLAAALGAGLVVRRRKTARAAD